MITDSTFQDFVLGGRKSAAQPAPALLDTSTSEDTANLDAHDAAMMDAYHGALGMLDLASTDHEAATASGDPAAIEAAAQRVALAHAQLEGLSNAYSARKGSGNAHKAAEAATRHQKPMEAPGLPGMDRSAAPEGPATATEEEDPFKKWLSDNGLSGGIDSSGQGGRSRDYMNEMQQILLGRAGLHFTPSFGGEQIAAAGARSEANDALRAQEAQNNAARTQAYLAAQERNAATGQQRLAGEEKKQESAEERFARQQSEVERHNKAVEEAAAAERARRAAAALAGKGAKDKKDADKDKDKNWKDVTELRKEFNQQPIVKSFGTQRQEFEKMKSAANNPSAAGDLMLIFSLMKILDPNSSVRESEAASASNAGGVPERVRNQWNNALSGQRLTPEQRADFVTQATRIFDTARSQYDEQASRYRDLATKIGGDPDDVVKADGFGGGKTSPSGSLVKVRQKSTGMTKSLNAADAKEFLADPDFEEVR